jgi:hypothetical protein
MSDTGFSFSQQNQSTGAQSLKSTGSRLSAVYNLGLDGSLQVFPRREREYRTIAKENEKQFLFTLFETICFRCDGIPFRFFSPPSFLN